MDKEKLRKAEQCLIDNGIEENKTQTVLEALGYILLDKDLYEDEKIEKIQRYFKGQGMLDEIPEIMLNHGERQYQYDECVENNYCMADFDRWQWLQNMLNCEMKFTTAMKIDSVLWEEGIEVMELQPKKEKALEGV